MEQIENSVLVQSHHPPIEELKLVESHLALLRATIAWDSVGILIDQDYSNQLILLLSENIPVSVLRVCLSVKESLLAIEKLHGVTGTVLLGYHQQAKLARNQIDSLQELKVIWNSIADQTAIVSSEELDEYFTRQRDDSKKKGRGKDFSVETKRKVLQYSHGRCMFKGCGIDLKVDELTGYEGNFGYLAHNVSSSEDAARGGTIISELLSDEPRNVLLLCDKHHRLVDRVAAADYPASILSKMRADFGVTANQLLNGLSYDPLPTYAVLWPVGGHMVASPSNLQVSRALSTINARPEGYINTLSDNNELLLDQNQSWSLLPDMISTVATNILQQTHNKQHRAALFAFGVMPALIGLGAKLGNKTQITPMLRFRDSGIWIWPLDEPKRDPIQIDIDNSIAHGDEEVVLSLSLTDRPKQFCKFVSENNLKEVAITPTGELFGNGCIGHPEDGEMLTNEVHRLLHKLVTDYSIQKIHLLPCASNAACVFVGKAIDNYHPDVIVYDFKADSMVPRLIIEPRTEGNQLRPVPT